MLSKRQKPQPSLQVPVPTFPLSSPITEEVEASSCSSAEDHELERSRPFDFLVKSTRQKVEKSQKEGGRSFNAAQLHRGHGESSRLSMGGIIKKKKAAKPVGLNLVTNFSLSATSAPKKTPDGSIAAPFVDLNDLKQLSRAREKERSIQKEKTKSTARRASRVGQRLEPNESHHGGFFLNPGTENSFMDRSDSGLSPSDRNVMIGLTVPYHESSDRSRELDSAGDQPLTPSIIVTPACEETFWSTDTASPEGLQPRATSSVYSQPTPHLYGSETDIPPVPAIPEEHSLSRKQTEESDYLNAHFVAMTQKRQSLSAGTIFENEIDSPEVERPRTIIDDNDQSPLNRLSVNTEASRPQSQGWWNVLLSPLLGRSNTLSSKKSPLSPRFPTPSPSMPGISQTSREKEISCFSPDTPETAVTNQWQERNKNLEQARSIDNIDAVPPVPNRQTAMSMMFPGHRVQGEAAEYYQACAHELFSKTPYFDCFNHVCSITPPNVIASQPGLGASVTGDRGLALAEAENQHTQPELKDAEAATAARGLLIDVDTPSPEAMKNSECAKCSHLRVSTNSTDSWASTAVDTVMDDNEKRMSELPHASSRELVVESPVQPMAQEPAQAPVQHPIAEPAPIPAAFFPPEPTPAPAPAPFVSPEPLMREAEPAPAPYIPSPPPAPAPQAMPHFIPVYPSNNPFLSPFEQQKPQPELSEWPNAPPIPQQYSQEPPQEADIVKMRGEPQDTPRDASRDAPQEDARTLEHLAPPEQHGTPQASEPISPGFQRAAGGPGSIPMSDVNAPAPAYAQHHRDAPLPERYEPYSAPEAAVLNPAGEVGPGESRRRRLEREDAAGRKIGGLWRGRGCFSKGGCYGRPGREGRLRRRWYLFIGLFFLIIVVLAIALATTLTRKSDETQVQSKWVNLTNYPPIQTGIMTIAGTEPQVRNSGCVNIETMWSCYLPKGTQQTENKPFDGNEPTFRVEIRYRNGTSNSTTSSNSTTTKRGVWTADPSPPSIADQTFLGNTTDGNAKPYAGEETPFYLSVLSAVHLTSTNVFRRSNSSIIPAPTEDSDGTPAAATLYPLPSSQPVRLYNRGESSEHYGFYTYFDKSIFLQSKAPLNDSVADYDSEDKSGGSTKAEAQARCTWSQTRFLVQIWTNPSGMGYSLLSSSGSSTNATATSTATYTSSTATSSSSATDYTRPGSFPYPVTVTVDRHGGDAEKRGCIVGALRRMGKLQIENRSVGGTLVNPALTSSSGSSSAYGGIDGGTGGCECQWVNWISTS
ncbi:uncharacterized protein N7503_004328 [Penicillium pulvis]|uniref:uncharacterized protein n=1 Tax=Penicillium pulvis TaxID=1562058 RepID=UPI002547745D|nr:uncharacterized protein N7503_004328 [Penicillium pulvis]KAJ5801878.1 hypothetical protein N7503_004328 [Penicillium pulvis]